jgi:hypothetical protein
MDSALHRRYAGKTPEQILAEDIGAQRQAEQARVQAQARRREAAIAAQQDEEAGHQEDAEDEDASSDDYEEFDEEFELAHIDEFGFFDDEEMCAAEECVAPYGTCVKNRYRGFDCQCAEGYQVCHAGGHSSAPFMTLFDSIRLDVIQQSLFV